MNVANAAKPAIVKVLAVTSGVKLSALETSVELTLNSGNLELKTKWFE